MAPLKLHHIDPQNPPVCWKYCGEVGPYIHCWWNCPIIKSSEESFLPQIKSITEYSVPMLPEVALLNLWEDPEIPTPRRDLIFI